MCYFYAGNNTSFSYDNYAAHDDGPAAKGAPNTSPSTASGTGYPSYVDGLMSGHGWTFVDGTRTITYSFQDDEFDAIDAADGSDDQNDWLGYEETSFVNAFSMISRYANIDFANSGFRNDDNANFQLHNYNSSWDGWGGEVPLGSFYLPVAGTATAGDGQFNRQSEGWSTSGLQVGGYGYVTVVHEIGHGLGLQHPFDPSPNNNGFVNYPGAGLAVLDDGLFTVMSYDDKNEIWNSFASKQSNWASFGQAGTLMAGDIAALQRMYGVRAGLSDGNNLYVLPEANAAGTYYSCIYDTGGIDTITAFNHAGAARIDLRPGTQVSKHTATFGGFTIAFDPAAGLSGADRVDAWIENAVGGLANDEIVGNQKANDLRGMQGADTIFGETNGKGIDDLFLSKGGRPIAADPRALNLGVDTAAFGNDTLYGGAGNDVLVGQGGDDRLYGEDDNDLMRGDVGADLLEGGAGDDTIYGHLDNVVVGPDDADTLRGGDGLDLLLGEEGNDLLEGGAGQDTLDGGSGNDVLHGGDGVEGVSSRDDLIAGYTGADTVFGGAGNDEIYGDGVPGGAAVAPGDDSLNGDGGADTIDGGGGADLIDGGVGNDTLKGGDGKDTLLGGAVDNDSLLGEGGDDSLDGGAGDDTIVGGADTLAAGTTDDDQIFAGAGRDRASGGAGNDRIDGGLDNDVLRGGAGADTIIGGAVDNDTLYGDAGNDSLDAGAGDDTLEGGEDGDTLLGGAGTDRLLGQAGADSLDGGDDLDALLGGLGDDVYVLRGHETVQEDASPVGGGKDTIEAHVGFTAVYANIDVFKLMNATANLASGNDLANEIIGNIGDDTLVGRVGNDTLRGGLGADRLVGSEGADVMNGEGGIDTYVFDGFDTIIDTGSDFGDAIETSVSASLFNVNIVGIEHLSAAAGTAAIDLTGNDGANQLTGNEGLNRLDGAGANDTLFGNGGADTLLGQAGLDTLKGGTGIDQLFGGADNDSLEGEGDADLVDGGLGHDVMKGGDGADTLVANGGRDGAEGGAGDDVLRVSHGDVAWEINSTISPASANGYAGVFFWSRDGGNADYARVDYSGIERFDVTGGSATDTLRGGDGNDTIRGGGGDDYIVTGLGADVVEGGGGTKDRWEADKSFLGETQAVTVDLTAAGAQTTYLVTGRVTGIEALTLKTGEGADSIRTLGSFLTDVIETDGGTDAVTVAGGRDNVNLGAGGGDLLTVDWSGVGYEITTSRNGDFTAGYGGIYYWGRDGNNGDYNRVDFAGVERFDLRSGAGADFLETGHGDDSVSGGAGDDHIKTDKGVDVIDGGAGGKDRWQADKSFATATQAIDVDLTQTDLQSSYLGAGAVRGVEVLSLLTGDGNDKIVTLGSFLRDELDLGAGDDDVSLAGGRDFVVLGAGTDTLRVDWSAKTFDIATTALSPNAAGGSDGTFFWSRDGNNGDYDRVDFFGAERFEMLGGSGSDLLRTGDFADSVSGAAGDDTLITGKGADTIDGGAQTDRPRTGDRWQADKSAATAAISLDLTKTGEQARFVIDGATSTVAGIEAVGLNGDERLRTGSGDDTVITRGNFLVDAIDTGAGGDIVKVSGGRDLVAMGDGIDKLIVDYADYDSGFVTTPLILTGFGYDGTVYWNRDGDNGDYSRVDFTGVDLFELRGSSVGDTLRTGDANDAALGNGGDDYLSTSKGADTVDGGDGVDRWDADKSAATSNIDLDLGRIGVQGSFAVDGGTNTASGVEALGTDATDRFQTGSGADVVNTLGGTLKDYIRTNGGADRVSVYGGRDMIDLGSGADTLKIDWSNVGYEIVVSELAKSSAGFAGTAYWGRDGNNGDYNRVDFEGADRFELYTGGANDVLRSGLGDDILSGGGGDDWLISDRGVDTVDGGAGVDRWEADKSTAKSNQSIKIDLNLTGVQSTYLGEGSVRGIEALTLKTGAGADVVTTRSSFLTDTVSTGGGADSVKLAGGRDAVDLGSGSDLLTVDWSKKTFEINSGFNDTLAKGYSGTFFWGRDGNNGDYDRVDFKGVERFAFSGGSAADVIRTGDGADTVKGGAGDDLLSTGKGVDIVDGGVGVDRWEADRSFATSTQAINVDLTKSVQSTHLGGSIRGIEALTLRTGAAADVIVTRNLFLADVIGVGGGADRVTVSGGRDSVTMGAGSDLLKVNWSALDFEVATNIGGSIAAGHDGVLFWSRDGNNGDYSRVDFSGVERFDIATGDLADSITTGDGADTLNGGGGADTLTGAKGDDVYVVDNANDVVVELAKSGSDAVLAKTSYVLAATAQVETLSTFTPTSKTAIDLTGNALANKLNGNAGANELDGGAGADTMTGFAGDDVYHVERSSDRVVEAAGKGADKVFASVTHTLAVNVENLELTGAKAINGTGNGAANAIVGNDKANRLDGAGGADVIDGGLGVDTLIGGSGKDILVFSSKLGASNIDEIGGFLAADDTIHLDDDAFSGLKIGKLASTAFALGTTAADALDRIIYDKASGSLFFDEDGSGTEHAAIKFATLGANAALTAADFAVIA